MKRGTRSVYQPDTPSRSQQYYTYLPQLQAGATNNTSQYGDIIGALFSKQVRTLYHTSKYGKQSSTMHQCTIIIELLISCVRPRIS